MPNPTYTAAAKRNLPWSAHPEEHLDAPAWSLFDCNGERICVGLTAEDRDTILDAVNEFWAD